MFERKPASSYSPFTYITAGYQFVRSVFRFITSPSGIVFTTLLSLEAIKAENTCMLAPYQPPFLTSNLQPFCIIDPNDPSLMLAIKKFPIKPLLNMPGGLIDNRNTLVTKAFKKFSYVDRDEIEKIITTKYIVELNNVAYKFKHDLLLSKKEIEKALINIVDIYPLYHLNMMEAYIAGIMTNVFNAIQLYNFKENLKSLHAKYGINLFSNVSENPLRIQSDDFFSDANKNPLLIHSAKFIDTLLALPNVTANDRRGRLPTQIVKTNSQELKRAFDMLCQNISINNTHFNLKSYQEWRGDRRWVTDLKMTMIVVFALVLFPFLALLYHGTTRILLNRLTNPANNPLPVNPFLNFNFFINHIFINYNNTNITINNQLVSTINSATLPEKDLLSESEIEEFEQVINTFTDTELKNRYLFYLNYYQNFLNDICAITRDPITDLTDPVSLESLTTILIKTIDRESIIKWINTCTSESRIATEPFSSMPLYKYEDRTEEEEKEEEEEKATLLFAIKRGYPNFVESFSKPARTRTEEALAEYDNTYQDKITANRINQT